MPTPSDEFRPACWTPTQAVAVVALAALLVVWSLAVISWPRATAVDSTPQGGRDLEAYRRIVERVHGGENYYSAAGAELRAGGYATSSVFNWRPPIYAWLLALFPTPVWGQVLLGVLALLALALAYAGDRAGHGAGHALLLIVTMVGAFLWCVDGEAYFSQELWAGVLIAVAVGCFGSQCRWGGIAAGLAALWLRELALPFVIVAMFVAWRERRWRELAVWCLGAGANALFLAWHAWQVQQHLTGHELAEASGWFQFGGPAFVVRTSQMNVWLFNLPAWVAVIYLITALVGFASWRGPQALLVGGTVVLYLAAFLVVGKAFNGYWGLLYVALLPQGLVRAVSSGRALRAAFDSPKRCLIPS
jgi:hypothetical protein